MPPVLRSEFEKMAGRSGELSKRAMAAARANHATRSGGRTGALTLREAATHLGISYKYARMASALLLSGMQFLIDDVDEGRKELWVAYGEYQAAQRGKANADPGRYGLYLITENGSDWSWKIGVGRVNQRFDSLQQGNPRPLVLRAFWEFRSSGKAKQVEEEVLAAYVPTQGGAEWLHGVDPHAVHRLVRQTDDGEWIVRPSGFTYEGLRE